MATAIASWLKAATEKGTKLWGKYETKLADATTVLVEFGQHCNDVYKLFVNNDIKVDEFYAWAYDVTGGDKGGKAKSTIDQYRAAARVFPGLPDEWRVAGSVPSIVELSILDKVDDSAARVEILEAVHSGDLNDRPRDDDGNPIRDAEKSVRIMANAVKDAALTDEGREKAERTRDAARTKLINALAQKVASEADDGGNLPVEFQKVLDAGGTFEQKAALAVALGARLGQRYGTRNGPSMADVVTSVLAPIVNPPEADEADDEADEPTEAEKAEADALAEFEKAEAEKAA